MAEETRMENIFEKQTATKVEKAEISTPEDTHKSSANFIRIASIVFGVFLLLSLWLYKYANPTFSSKIFWMLFIFIILLAVLIFFTPTIIKKFQDEKVKDLQVKLPPAASLATLRGLAEEALCNDFFCNHIAKILDEKMIYVGKDVKNKIYLLKGKLLYREPGQEGIVYILINSHDAENTRSILIDPSSTELTKSINNLCSSPEDSPDEEEVVTENPLLGTREVRRKKTKPHEKEINNKSKEDL